MLSRTDIIAAAERIAPYVRRTPVMVLAPGDSGGDFTAYLKLESFQHAGVFKVRGAFNRILSAPQVPASGVIAASGGNHGLAVAYAAQKLGYPAEIYVPTVSSPLKQHKILEYGAKIVVGGDYYADALQSSERRAAETGALFVYSYEQQEVIAGQGTLSREFQEQVPDLDTILIAVGGGGLIAGASAWFGKSIKVIGVEPELIPSMHNALQAGQPVDVHVSGIAADSLGAKRVGDTAFEIGKDVIDRVLLVSDETIKAAQRHLWDNLRLVAEPGGATAYSALWSGAYVPQSGERVGVVVCGGNTDPGSVV
jgi:threonine dehydratase